MPATVTSEGSMEIAIIGGGIVGLVLAAGLIRQKVRVEVFEQARNFREIGAGIGFTARTVECMERINPAIVTALRTAGAVNVSLDDQDPNAYFRWVDGYTQHREDDPAYQKMLSELDAGYRGWDIVRRDHFLENLVKVIPPGVVHLQKRLDRVEEKGRDDKLVLRFVDGTTAEADAGKFRICVWVDSRPFMGRLTVLSQSSPVTASSLGREKSCSVVIIPLRILSTRIRSHTAR